MTNWLSITVLGFGALVACFAVGLNMKLGHGWGTNTIRTLSIVLIVTAILFLVTLGLSSEIVANAFALLGTIAGFILGKTDQGSTKV